MRPMSLREENEYLAYERWCENQDRDQSDEAWEEFQEEMAERREDWEMEQAEARAEARRDY